jgi:hypothetical protein
MNEHEPNGQEQHVIVNQKAASASTHGEPSAPSSGTRLNSESTKEPNYEVGYRRPPTDHQFKPGQSGNPGGRPKTKPNLRGEIEDVLTELVTVNFGGTERSLSVVAAVIRKQCEKALEGHDRSAESIVKRATELGFLREPNMWDEMMRLGVLDDDGGEVE